jgi:hypothetical protein
LSSRRYNGRRHGSLDLGAEGDDTVDVRDDFRNSMGGLLIAPITISCLHTRSWREHREPPEGLANMHVNPIDIG